jgi:hypothetical protein
MPHHLKNFSRNSEGKYLISVKFGLTELTYETRVIWEATGTSSIDASWLSVPEHNVSLFDYVKRNALNFSSYDKAVRSADQVYLFNGFDKSLQCPMNMVLEISKHTVTSFAKTAPGASGSPYVVNLANQCPTVVGHHVSATTGSNTEKQVTGYIYGSSPLFQ